MLERINKILKGQIVTSVLYTALGLCFILMPVDTVNIICKFVFGVVLILAGVYPLLDLLSGGMILVIGIFLFFNPQIVVKLLPVLLGTFVLVDSIWVLKGSLKLKKIGRGEWKILLIGSLVFIGLGIAMIVDPFDIVKYTMIFAGCVMLANGVTDFVFLVLMRRGIKKAETALEEAVEAAETVDAEFSQVQEDTAAGQQEPEYAPWSSRSEVTEDAGENTKD